MSGKLDDTVTIPDYLREYLDEQEIKSIQKKMDSKISEKDFWNKYKFELVKDDGVNIASTARNAENVENERNLTYDERQALIAICEKDLYLFAIRYFSHYLKKTSSPLHTYLYEYISNNMVEGRDEGFKHAIAAPRGNAKSTIISNITPIWVICYKKKNFITMISDTIGQACDFLADVKRELEFNEKLAQDFPHVVGKGPTWRADEIITNNDVRIRALGTGSKIRGRKFGPYRPDLILLDDLESSEMVRSESQRKFIRYEWFAKDLMYAGETGEVTDFLLAGTILGPHSLLNNILDPEEFPEWTSKKFAAVHSFAENEEIWGRWEKLFKDRFDPHRKITALDFFAEHKEDMLAGTKVLWPEGDPYYDLMMWRVSDPSGFLSEKQNNPLDPSKLILPEEMLRVVDFEHDIEIQRILQSRKTQYYGSLDPSLGKKTTGDYSAIITLARDPVTGIILVVDMDLEKRSVDKQIEDVFLAHQRYNYALFAIETNAFQVVLADNIRKKSKEESVYLRIKEIRNYQDKTMRIKSLVPLATDNTLIFDLDKIHNDQSYFIAWEQITTYSGDISSSYDDAPDALEMAVRVCTKPKFKLLTKQNK